MKKNFLFLIISLSILGCKKDNSSSCYDSSLIDENQICLDYCDGFVGCDGEIYCNACYAAKEGIGPE